MSPFVLVVLALLGVAFWRQVVAIAVVAITVVFVVGSVDVAHMLQTAAPVWPPPAQPLVLVLVSLPSPKTSLQSQMINLLERQSSPTGVKDLA